MSETSDRAEGVIPLGSLSEAEKFFTAVAHRVKVYSGRIQFIQYTSTLQRRLIFKIPGYKHTVENVDV